MPEIVAVGGAWRETATGEPGRVVVVTEISPGRAFIYARNEAAPHRRTRIARDEFLRRFHWIGAMSMDAPEHWPAWFREDARPAALSSSSEEAGR